jgi:hypothetical protein
LLAKPRESGCAADEQGGLPEGDPEPEWPPRWPERRCCTGRKPRRPLGGRQSGVPREGTRPPCPEGTIFGSDSLGAIRGEGKANPMGVCGWKTPPGSRRGKPSRSWETAKADRSGCGNPRRGAMRMRGFGRCGTITSGSGFLELGAPEGNESHGRRDATKVRWSPTEPETRTGTRPRSSWVNERP